MPLPASTGAHGTQMLMVGPQGGQPVNLCCPATCATLASQPVGHRGFFKHCLWFTLQKVSPSNLAPPPCTPSPLDRPADSLAPATHPAIQVPTRPPGISSQLVATKGEAVQAAGAAAGIHPAHAAAAAHAAATARAAALAAPQQLARQRPLLLVQLHTSQPVVKLSVLGDGGLHPLHMKAKRQNGRVGGRSRRGLPAQKAGWQSARQHTSIHVGL